MPLDKIKALHLGKWCSWKIK